MGKNFNLLIFVDPRDFSRYDVGMKIKILTLLSLLSLSPLSYSLETVTTGEEQELTQSNMVRKVNWKEGYIWPEVRILTVLDHLPQDNLNEFLNFETHKTYIPDMLESKVIKKISPNELNVYFEMEMPWPVKKTTHVTHNLITKNTDGSYTLKWNLVKADMLSATDGFMRFYPYKGKTLLEYVSHIVPNSSLASMFKNRVADDVEKSVKKIVKHLNNTLNKRENLSATTQKTNNL